MKRSSLYAIAIATLSVALAANPAAATIIHDSSWTDHLEAPVGANGSNAVAVTTSGDSYVGGFSGTNATLDKLGPTGSVIWHRSINLDPGANHEAVTAVTTSVAGKYVYVSGVTRGLAFPMSFDSFVQKYDNNGTLIWTRSFGGGTPSGIAYHWPTDSVVVATLLFSGLDEFRRIDGGGTTIWTRTHSNPDVRASDVAIAGSDFILAGKFFEGVSVGSGDDLFIESRDIATGLVVNYIRFVDAGMNAQGSSVSVDEVTGDVCVAGGDGNDGVVSRFTSVGVFQWTALIDIGGTEQGTSDVAAKHGGLGCAAVGLHRPAPGFGPTDGYLADVNAAGVVVDTEVIGSANATWDDLVNALAIPASGTYAGRALTVSSMDLFSHPPTGEDWLAQRWTL